MFLAWTNEPFQNLKLPFFNIYMTYNISLKARWLMDSHNLLTTLRLLHYYYYYYFNFSYFNFEIILDESEYHKRGCDKLQYITFCNTPL